MSQRAYAVGTERDRTKLMLAVLDCLWRYNDAEKKQIAKEAGVHWTTLYSWCGGQTINPRIDTLTLVAQVLGFRIVLKRDTKLPRPQRGLRLVKP